MERRDQSPNSNAPLSLNDDAINYLTFPFAISERPDGGLPTVIINEAQNSEGRKVGMFTTDPRDVTNFEGVAIHPADNAPITEDTIRLWFGTGYWSVLHPKAHTDEALTAEAVSAMYPQQLVQQLYAEAERAGNPISAAVGTQEFLHRFVKRYAPTQDRAEAFNRAFEEPVLAELKRASSNQEAIRFNFQDYFFHPLVDKIAPVVRDSHGFSSLHLHTTIPMIPDSLPLPRMVEDLAIAASKVDVVLTHTETYNERLRMMMKRLGCRLPEFRTFSLGIDESDLLIREGKISAANYHEAIPDFFALSERQRAFIHACFNAEKECIPHQFGLFDRMDPGKGIDTVFLGIDNFLSEARRHLSIEELQTKYRFFSLMSNFSTLSNVDPTNMKATYAEHVTLMGQRLEQKWPGIFFMAEGLSGNQRDLLIALMRGRTVVTGGAEDGLNQVVMESSFINRNLPTGVIAGKNIGFVMQMESLGMTSKLFTFESGKPEALAENMRDVVAYQLVNPDYLVRQKTDLNRVIESRNCSMLINE